MEIREFRPRLSSAGCGASTVIVVQEVRRDAYAAQKRGRRNLFME
jgi:hypothetical protein